MGLLNTTVTAIRPAPIVTGDNPIIIELNSGSLGTASKAKGKFRIISDNTVGMIVTITLTGATNYIKSFYSVKYPNSDDKFLCSELQDSNGNSISTVITATQIASSFADCLKKDTVIGPNYNIMYSGGTFINVVAKDNGSQFKFANVNITTPFNISYTQVANGGDAYQGNRIPGYSLYIEPYKGLNTIQLGEAFNISNFERVSDLILPFSSDNVHRFDISNVAKNFLNTPKPDFNVTGFTTTENTVEKYVLPFFTYYGEQYPLSGLGTNTIKKFQKGKTANQFWVCNASLPFTSGNNFTSYTGVTSNKLLSNQPSNKYCQRDQHELLYLLINKDANADFSVRSNIEFWDGSMVTGRTLYYLFTGATNYGGLYVCNVSHQNHLKQIEIGEGKRIKSAEIWINRLHQYTDSITYNFPYTDTNDTFNVTFQNSLGTYDTVSFLGYKEYNNDRTKKDLQSPININQNGSFSPGFKSSSNYAVQVTKKVTVNTGFVNQEHFDWLIELLKSNNIYRYDNGLEYIKLDSYKYSKNNQSNEYNIECTFIMTIAENSVSI